MSSRKQVMMAEVDGAASVTAPSTVRTSLGAAQGSGTMVPRGRLAVMGKSASRSVSRRIDVGAAELGIDATGTVAPSPKGSPEREAAPSDWPPEPDPETLRCGLSHARTAMSEAADEEALRKLAGLPPPRRRGLAAAGFSSVMQKWKRLKNAVVGIVRAGKLVAADRNAFVSENTRYITEARKGMLDVELEVDDPRDLDSINYVRQGNASMYSDEMLAARRTLRAHPQVVAAAQAWWRWLPKSSTRVVVVAPSQQQQEDDVFAATLDKPVYSAMVVLITLVLLPRFGLHADPNYDPSDDWASDSKGMPFLEFPTFFDAIFELADLWSEGVGGPEYASLLEWLLQGCQDLERRRGTFTTLLRKFGHPMPPPPSDSPPSTPPPSSPPAPAAEAVAAEPEPEQDSEDEEQPASPEPEPEPAPAPMPRLPIAAPAPAPASAPAPAGTVDAEPPEAKKRKKQPPPPSPPAMVSPRERAPQKQPPPAPPPPPPPAAATTPRTKSEPRPKPDPKVAAPLPPLPPVPPAPAPKLSPAANAVPPPPPPPPSVAKKLQPPVGEEAHSVLVGPLHHESDVVIPTFEWPNFGDVESSVAAYIHQQLPHAPPHQRRPSHDLPLTLAGTGLAHARRRTDESHGGGGGGGGSDGSGGFEHRRRTGHGEDEGSGGDPNEAHQSCSGAWQIGDGAFTQAGGGGGMRERTHTGDTPPAAEAGGPSAGSAGDSDAANGGQGAAGGGVRWHLGDAFLSQQHAVVAVGGGGGGSAAGVPPRQGGGNAVGHIVRGGSILRPLGGALLAEGSNGGWHIQPSGGLRLAGWRHPSPSAVDTALLNSAASRADAAAAAGAGLRSGGSAVFGWELPPGLRAAGSLYSELMEGVLLRNMAQQRLGPEGMAVQGTATGSRSPNRSRTSDPGNGRTSPSRRSQSGAAQAGLAALGGSFILHHESSINAPLQAQASAPNLFPYGSPPVFRARGVSHVGSPNPPARSRSRSRSPKHARSSSPTPISGLSALAAAAAHHLPSINSWNDPGGGSPGRRGGGGGGGAAAAASRSRSPTTMPNLQRPSSLAQVPPGVAPGPTGAAPGGGGGGVGGASSSVSTSGATSSAAHTAAGGGGGGGGGASVLLPQLSVESSRGGTAAGGGSHASHAAASGGSGGRSSGLLGVGPVIGLSVNDGSAWSKVAPYRPRDLVKASRDQVMTMAAALVNQQQQQAATRPHALASAGATSSGAGRLESLRPLNGEAKRAACGGSFQAYLQQGGKGAAAPAAGALGAPLPPAPATMAPTVAAEASAGEI